jgi:hypothetical protein
MSTRTLAAILGASLLAAPALADPLQIATDPPASTGSERRAGNLVVPAQPVRRPDDPGQRLRSHVEGALTAREVRTWVGPPVPAHVGLAVGTQELFLLDEIPGGGHLAFYRDPYGASSCGFADMWRNCAYTLRLYAPEGALRAEWPLNPLLSAERHLEIQDVQYSDGIVYFNEACQTYAADAKGRCSSLSAMDPVSGKSIWRSKPLVSNSRFRLGGDLGDLILTGYGFTAEPDFVYLLDRKDGRVLDRRKVRTAPEIYTPLGDETFRVTLYDASTVDLRVERRPGKTPRLAPSVERTKIQYPDDCTFVAADPDAPPPRATRCAEAVAAFLQVPATLAEGPGVPPPTCDFDAPERVGERPMRFLPWQPGLFLLEIRCTQGAYNTLSRHAVYDERGTAPVLRMLDFAWPADAEAPDPLPLKRQKAVFGRDWDARRSELTVWAKHRGMGDCGVFGRYRLSPEGGARLMELRSRTTCDGRVTDPKTWPARRVTAGY